MHINRSPKATVIGIGTLFLLIGTSISFVASAQQTVVIGDAQTYAIGTEPLEQAKLDQLLAPIALYPDSLLSQILVAATYPLEVVQANRWRQANQSLTEDQVIAAIEDKQWDPSVKALTPFTDLIARLSKDLDWLQQLGDAFLQNEGQVLASVQELRQKARDNGSIADNDYYDVVEEDNNIIIKSTRRDIVYVPYYDSRVVYGPWGWRDYQPVYWHHPSHYRLHAGFYWSDRFYIRPTLFFGGFHWSSRNLVVNHHFYDRPYRHSNRYRDNRVSDYRHWNHNPVHRRGVRYSRNGNRNSFYRDQFNSQYRASRLTGEHSQERSRVGNRLVSNIPRNRETIRRTERNRVQQQEQNRRDGLRVERRDRDNSGRSQRRSNRVQRPTIRTADTTIVNNRESYRRRLSNDRSVPNQQSASRPARTDSSVNRRNNAANVRTAPVANSPPKRTVAPRQSSVDSRNNNTNNRSSARNTSKYNPRHRGSNTRSH
ncbi:MAG: DUF3300 domain-containing protein, partial [Arenicella sp.]|nr:DUF3300 domain-containing protein [Arenicella sp.]